MLDDWRIWLGGFSILIIFLLIYYNSNDSKDRTNKIPKGVESSNDTNQNIKTQIQYTQIKQPNVIVQPQGGLSIGIKNTSFTHSVENFNGKYTPYTDNSIEKKYLSLRIKWETPQPGTLGIYKPTNATEGSDREEANQYVIKIWAIPDKTVNNETNPVYKIFSSGMLVLQLHGELDSGWKHKGYKSTFNASNKELYQKDFNREDWNELSNQFNDEFNEKYFCGHAKVARSSCDGKISELPLSGSEFGHFFESSTRTKYNVMIYVTHKGLSAEDRMAIEKNTQVAQFEWDPQLIKMRDVPADRLKSFNAFMLINAANILKNQALMYKRIDQDGYIIVNEPEEGFINNGILNKKNIWDGQYVFTFALSYDTNNEPIGNLRSGGKYLLATFGTTDPDYKLVDKEQSTKFKAMMEQGSANISTNSRTIILSDIKDPENTATFELKPTFDKKIGDQFNTKKQQKCWRGIKEDRDFLMCGIGIKGIGGGVKDWSILTDKRRNWGPSKSMSKDPKNFTIVPNNIYKRYNDLLGLNPNQLQISFNTNPSFQNGDNEAEIELVFNSGKRIKGFFDGNMFYFKLNNNTFYGRTKLIKNEDIIANKLQIKYAEETNAEYFEFSLN